MAVENPQEHDSRDIRDSGVPGIWDLPDGERGYPLSADQETDFGCSLRDLDARISREIGPDKAVVLDNQGKGSQGPEIGESAVCKGCRYSIRNIVQGLDALEKEAFSWIDHGGYWNIDYPCIAAREDEDFRTSLLPIISETNGVESCSRFSPTTAERVRVITAALKGLVRVETGEATRVKLREPSCKVTVYPNFGCHLTIASLDGLKRERHLVLGDRVRIVLPPKTEVV